MTRQAPTAPPAPLDLTAPDIADAAESLPDDRLPAQVREIADLCADELRRAGLAEPDARRLGVRLAGRLARELGGATYYWPKGDALERAVRDLSVWAEHDGTVDGPAGIKALARKHGITTVWVWAIIRRERARHIANVQHPLPLSGA